MEVTSQQYEWMQDIVSNFKKIFYSLDASNAANFRKFIEIYTKDIQKVLAACSIKKNTCDNEEVCKSCSG